MDDRIRRGIAHFNAGRFDAALLCFRAAIAGGDRGPQTRGLLAHALDASGRPAESAAEFLSVLADFPRRPPAYDGLAGLILRRGPLPGAGAALRGALALKTPRTLRLCARAWQASGDLDAAEAALRKAVRLAPRDKESRRLLLDLLRARAQAGLAAGELDAAEKALRRALSVLPRDRGARAELSAVLRRRAQARLAAGELGAAEKMLRRALTLDPRDGASRALRAEALRLRVRSLQSAGRRREAEAVSRRILKLDPLDARARLSRGEVLYLSGRRSEGRALLSRAVRLDRGTLAPFERFKALMKLGRGREAVAVAERLLDGKPALADLRAFWDPWEWDERLPRAARRDELRKLERSLGGRAPGPWLHYYRADLTGPEGLSQFEMLAAYPAERYGWMYFKAATAALLASRFSLAASWFQIALKHEPMDWRARAFLAEACLCLQRPADAYAEMDRALRAAPPGEAGQALAWRGAFDLWLGRYEEALASLEEACRLDAQCAFCWKAGALLLLGRDAEALEALDLTLRRYPLDFEAYIWRGEAKRRLGMHREALKDLDKVPAALGMWALFNRALVKQALGDRAGMKADFDALPARVVDYIRAKTGLEDREGLLRAGLELSRGFRRAEYGQAIWMV